MKMLIWNPVFIWFQSFVFETAWLSFFQVTITWKTTKCANTCLNLRQKHDSQVVINFNQFHSPLESCQEWNLSPFQVCTIASTDPIFNSKEWLRIYLPKQKLVQAFQHIHFILLSSFQFRFYFIIFHARFLYSYLIQK